jgi:hypothetical protein
MSELLDTPSVTREACPVCEPEYDPRALLELRFCHRHEPDRAGIDEIRWETDALENGDAGGDSNRAFCDFVHRKRA